MPVQILHSLDEDRWRDFVATHPDGNIFHTPEMFRVFSGAEGNTPELWAAVDERILALMVPVRISLAARMHALPLTRSVVYGGPLCAPGPEGQEGLALLLRSYNRSARGRTLFTECRNLCESKCLQDVLAREGFDYEDHLNYLIDLAPAPEAIFQNIGVRTRKHIRRAMRKGAVAVEEITDRRRIPECYSLLYRTYREAEVPLAHPSLFKKAFDVLHPKGMIRYTLGSVEGTPAAVSVELLYKNVAYGWYGGSNRDFSACAPNELLMWRILEWCSANGYTTYDFGGAGRPEEAYGPREFKAKFGGTLVCFGRNIKVHSPQILKISKFSYSLIRGFLWGRTRAQ